MFKQKIKILLLIFFISSCTENVSKKQKIEYYPSGKIKSKGWYVRDTVHVDTLITFFANGKIATNEVYDSVGNAVQAKSYYDNGIMSVEVNYKNGLANGFGYVYYESGNIEQKKFHINDSLVGDAFFYAKNNNIKTYGFYEWTGKNINLIKYDSSIGDIKKDMRQVIYIDSIKIYQANNNSYLELQLVVSNPPHCKSIVRLDYLSKNGFIIKSDSVIGSPYYFSKEKLCDSLIEIRFSATQYDSLMNESFEQTNRRKIIH